MGSSREPQQRLAQGARRWAVTFSPWGISQATWPCESTGEHSKIPGCCAWELSLWLCVILWCFLSCFGSAEVRAWGLGPALLPGLNLGPITCSSPWAEPGACHLLLSLGCSLSPQWLCLRQFKRSDCNKLS